MSVLCVVDPQRAPDDGPSELAERRTEERRGGERRAGDQRRYNRRQPASPVMPPYYEAFERIAVGVERIADALEDLQQRDHRRGRDAARE